MADKRAKICPTCGATNEAGAAFCSFCGTSLAGAGAAQEPEQELTLTPVEDKPEPAFEPQKPRPAAAQPEPEWVPETPKPAAARPQPMASATKALGIVSIVLGVLGLCIAGIPLGIAAALVGILAVVKKQGLGWVGIALGVLDVVLAIVASSLLTQLLQMGATPTPF